jgi:hypothetical protein
MFCLRLCVCVCVCVWRRCRELEERLRVLGARMFELQHDFMPKRPLTSPTGDVAEDVLTDVEATRAGTASPLRKSPGTASLRVLGSVAMTPAKLRALIGTCVSSSLVFPAPSISLTHTHTHDVALSASLPRFVFNTRPLPRLRRDCLPLRTPLSHTHTAHHVTCSYESADRAVRVRCLP